MLSTRALAELLRNNVRISANYATTASGPAAKRGVIFLEAEGGPDKGPDGHRKDTMPMVKALRARGIKADAKYYKLDKATQFLEQMPKDYAVCVPRINPGSMPGGEGKWFSFLRSLAKQKVKVFEHPDDLIKLDVKDLLPKLNDTPLVPKDTLFYKTMKHFAKEFPKTLALRGDRVLKQNRGATGTGVWRVELPNKKDFGKGVKSVSLDAMVKATEAKDNHVERMPLRDFIEMCRQYIEKPSGGICDMAFLPRVSEGELRLLMVARTPIFLVVKTPMKGEFSANLFAGATYDYRKPSEFKELCDMFLNDTAPVLVDRLGLQDVPLIWCADFIRHWDENDNDSYVLCEVNCSCVGFTSHLDQGIQDLVADELIKRMKK